MDMNTPEAGQRETVQHTKNPFKLATALLSVLVVVLVGLSVFQYLQANDASSKVETTDVATTTEPATTTQATNGDGPYLKGGYLYVPHWGVKYKLDDTLAEYGYSVQPDSTSSSFGSYVVGLTAVQKSDLVEGAQQAYYDTIAECSVITITQTTQDTSNVSGPKKVVSFDGVSYVVFDYTSQNACVHKKNLDVVAEKLTAIVSSPEKL